MCSEMIGENLLILSYIVFGLKYGTGRVNLP